jgi:hypothetical protein
MNQKNNKPANNKGATNNKGTSNNKQGGNNKNNKNKNNGKVINNLNKGINNLNQKSEQVNNNLNKLNKNQNNLLNSTEQVLNNSINNLNSLNNNIAQLQEDLAESNNNSKEPFYIKYKTHLIVLGVIILVIVLYFLGMYIYKKFFKNTSVDKHKFFIENAESSEQNSITNLEIVPPRNGYDFSISFWIHINDLYQYKTTWRHIFHKGPYDTKDVINFEDWDDLTAVHREQNPGCWLHPNSPKLRYVLTIQPGKEFCGMFKNQNTCKERTYCNWEGDVCNLERLHPKDLYNESPIDYIDTQEGDHVLQYVDIDIPVNEVHHVAFVLEQKNLNVFQNGKLTQTAKFMGEPIFNKNDLHLFAKNNFSGNLLNWTYFPDTISREKVQSLANELPNFDKIPKKRLASDHLKKGRVVNAVKSLF